MTTPNIEHADCILNNMPRIFEGMTVEPLAPAKTPVTVSCLPENLYRAMKEVQIIREHSLPVLNHVRIAIVDGCIELTTTDLEKINKSQCGCKEHFSLAGAYRWSTCVPMIHKYEYNGDPTKKPSKRKASPFLDWLKVVKEFCDPLTLVFNPGLQLLTIKQGRSKTVFKCIDAQEFPPCKEVEG